MAFSYSSASPVVVLPAASHPQSFGNPVVSGSTSPRLAHRQFSKSLPASFAQWPRPLMAGAPAKDVGYFSAGAPRAAPRAEAAWPGIRRTVTTNALSSVCGRKRCRDEYASSTDADDGSDPMGASPASEPVRQPVEGLSSSVVNGFSIAAASQTNAWLDANSPAVSVGNVSADRAVLNPRRKLQRLHSRMASEMTVAQADAMGVIVSDASSSKSHPVEPTVDDFTLRLGIGWTRLGDDPDKQAAARGWARYIENHFPGVRNARILLQSKSLDDAFLVATDQGLFLFDEGMSEARLVGATEDQALANLTAVPVAFVPGSEILRAVGTPRHDVVVEVNMNQHVAGVVVPVQPAGVSAQPSSDLASSSSMLAVAPDNTMSMQMQGPISMHDALTNNHHHEMNNPMINDHDRNFTILPAMNPAPETTMSMEID